jgi:UDP-glucose 4-epimerase
MKQQTILVTGGAGFVGSVCVELLVAQGYKVIVLDNLQTGNRRAVHPKARLVRGSIGNARLLRRVMFGKPAPPPLNLQTASVFA